MKETTLRNEKGFALLAAIIASLILLAVGILVINMSAGNLILSSASEGNKKAMAAVDTGVFKLVENFSNDSTTWTSLPGYDACPANVTVQDINSTAWQSVSNADLNTKYVICAPTVGNTAPLYVAGYTVGQWGYVTYNVTVLGENSYFNSFAKVDVGIGYGPVPLQ